MNLWRRPSSKKAKVDDVKTMLSCETSRREWKLKMWKRRCRAGLSSKSEKLQMWNRTFRARHPSKSENGKCENEPIARDSLQKVKSWRCETEAFVPDLPQRMTIKDVQTKLSFFSVKLLCHETSYLWDFFAVRSICFEIAVRLLCCETSLLWDFSAVRLLCCEISLLWDFFAVRLLCCEIFLLWDFNDFQKSVTWKLDFRTPFHNRNHRGADYSGLHSAIRPNGRWLWRGGARGPHTSTTWWLCRDRV